MLGTAALRTKSPEAFRTISEVAIELDVPQHVLRFWEGRFAQIKPVKRAGGRRYYRPEDVDLLRGIRSLLYSDGFTIKGVQKILRDKGTRFVADLGRGELADGAPAPVLRMVAPRSNVIALERLAESMREPLRDVAPSPAPTAAEGDDEREPALPLAVAASPVLPEENRVRLEILLAGLQQMKAKLVRARSSSRH